MSYKPPHSTTSILFSSPREHARKAEENRKYDEDFRRGQAFADGQKSRKGK